MRARLFQARSYNAKYFGSTGNSGKPEKGDFFKCPICQKSYIIYRVGSDITLDHDHRTGEPRGYICGSCNTGLGRFRNGSIFIYRAAAYLRQHYEDAD